MAHHLGHYFDAALFGQLVLMAYLLIDKSAPVSEVPARLARRLQERKGVLVEPAVIEAIIGGDHRWCDVALFRAIVETTEPHGGAHWFDPAFDPESARNFWRVNMEREVL